MRRGMKCGVEEVVEVTVRKRVRQSMVEDVEVPAAEETLVGSVSRTSSHCHKTSKSKVPKHQRLCALSRQAAR